MVEHAVKTLHAKQGSVLSMLRQPAYRRIGTSNEPIHAGNRRRQLNNSRFCVILTWNYWL